MGVNRKISIGIADDHAMLRKGLIRLLSVIGNFEFLFEVDNGNEVIEALKKHLVPDILILDVHMAEKNGKQTAEWVTQHYPQVKILALSMASDEESILGMIQAGAKGYLTKNNEPEKLKEAIEAVYTNGHYLPESLSAKIFSGIQNNVLASQPDVSLTQREKLFLSFLCQELSYNEIAKRMFISPRTVDDYRKKLTRKLNVKGKAGLIVYAMNHKLT